MTTEVYLTATAEQQMHAAAEWYAKENPDFAANWFNGLLSVIEGIAENPEQFPQARENEQLPVQARQMLYGPGKRKTHRVLFVVRETRIVVHQIRHVAQQDVEEL